MAFSARILGDDRVKRQLKDAQRQAKQGQKRLLKQVERTVFESFERQFSSAGREFGSPWPALTQATIRIKESLGFAQPARILVRTGRLKAELTRASRAKDKTKRGEIMSFELGSARRAGGTSLVRFHASHGRSVMHPQTGIAGSGLRELNRLWERYADSIRDELK